MDKQPLINSKYSSWEIEYRQYQPADSEKCIALENESSQVPRLGGLLDVGTIFNGEYDSKCKNFPDHVIVVAEATNPQNPSEQVICGATCLGIKDMFFNGEPVRAGVLFDLRVSEKFQKRGIATKIMKLTDETAMSKGAQFIYLSVNSQNQKARSLYKKLGYDIISERSLRTIQIGKALHDSKCEKKIVKTRDGAYHPLSFDRLEKTQALDYSNKFYHNQDLALTDFDNLFSTPNYSGTYTVSTEDGKNVMGVTLFKFDTNSFFGLKRFFVPTYCYTKDWFYALQLAFWISVTFGVTNLISDKLAYLFPSHAYQTWVFNFIFFLLSIAVIMVYNLFVNFMLIVGGYKLRGRYIAPFYYAENEDLLPDMFEFLLKRMGKIASDFHIHSITYNCDKDDRFWKLWKPTSLIKGRTYFMGRYLENHSSAKNLQNRVPTPALLFDPRDI